MLSPANVLWPWPWRSDLENLVSVLSWHRSHRYYAINGYCWCTVALCVYKSCREIPGLRVTGQIITQSQSTTSWNWNPTGCNYRCHSIIENVYDVVKLQYLDLRAALTGRGNFVLIPTMSRHQVPYQIWSTTSTECKDQLYQRFLRDNGVRQRVQVVTSKDGTITMPATPRVARKPEQVARPRGSRTPTRKYWCRRRRVCVCYSERPTLTYVLVMRCIV